MLISYEWHLAMSVNPTASGLPSATKLSTLLLARPEVGITAGRESTKVCILFLLGAKTTLLNTLLLLRGGAQTLGILPKLTESATVSCSTQIVFNFGADKGFFM